MDHAELGRRLDAPGRRDVFLDGQTKRCHPLPTGAPDWLPTEKMGHRRWASHCLLGVLLGGQPDGPLQGEVVAVSGMPAVAAVPRVNQ